MTKDSTHNLTDKIKGVEKKASQLLSNADLKSEKIISDAHKEAAQYISKENAKMDKMFDARLRDEKAEIDADKKAKIDAGLKEVKIYKKNAEAQFEKAKEFVLKEFENYIKNIK